MRSAHGEERFGEVINEIRQLRVIYADIVGKPGATVSIGDFDIPPSLTDGVIDLVLNSLALKLAALEKELKELL